jgi:hypothetical protein
VRWINFEIGKVRPYVPIADRREKTFRLDLRFCMKYYYAYHIG